MVGDPIADMLTRIRNAGKAKHPSVSMPSSKIKIKLAEKLKEQGYIENFEFIKDSNQGVLKIFLRYYNTGSKDFIVGSHSILNIERVSKQGRRVYWKCKDIKSINNGLGVTILSTSKGIMTDKQAKKEKLGGEVLCNVW